MVADVLEVPARTVVPWRYRLPSRRVADHVRRLRFRHVRERETLGRERDLCAACVIERSQVCPDAVVVGDARARTERQGAPGRG